MNQPFLAHITGNPNIPTLARVNVRSEPGTSGVSVLFEANIGTRNLPVIDVKPDKTFNALNGKVYQWFQVQFSNGVKGWVRDDLVSIQGDGTTYGYPILPNANYALVLLRQLLPITPPPAPTPEPEPEPTEPTDPTEPTEPEPIPDVTGTVISLNGLNMREAPISGKVIHALPYHAKVKIVDARPQGGTSNYIWAKVEAGNDTGWMRTDFLSISGDGSALGLSKGDEYPAPLNNYWWIRGQNQNQNPSEAQHAGWDFSADAGKPVLAGPNGGYVARLLTCTRCTASRPNTLSQGIPLDNASVFLDAAWGYGYGNAVIMRYSNDLLPDSTLERLEALNIPGAHLFVIYAHMSSISVQAKQNVASFAQIGVIGNTGNSTATHLHVEVRASFDPFDTNWGGMRGNLLDPSVLFLR